MRVFKSWTGMRLYEYGPLSVCYGFTWIISVMVGHWGFEINRNIKTYRVHEWPKFSDFRTLGAVLGDYQIKLWTGKLDYHVSLGGIHKRDQRFLWLSNADCLAVRN